MRLLITRPEPDNARTAAALRAQGHEVVLAPLLLIEAVQDADLGADLGTPPSARSSARSSSQSWAAILITSASGVRALAGHPRRAELLALPVLAVGQASGDAARAAGFADVSSGDGNADDLAQLAAQRFAGVRLPLLYLAGEDRSSDLAGALAVRGLAVRTVVIYRAAKAGRFPPTARAALEQGQIDGVLHFSRRSVESYIDCGRDIIGPALKPVHYCLSVRAAEPLRLAGAERIWVASQPDEASLLALVTPKS
jgi:uroporphyrinogen-III synthase